MRGYTKKPCPGCGSTEHYRPTLGVCSDCRNAIAKAKQDTEEAAARGPDEPICLSVPTAAHWLPYVPNNPRDRVEDRDVKKIFHDLILAESEVSLLGVEGELVIRGDRNHYGGYEARTLRPSVAKLINELYQEIIAISNHAYKQGVDRGHSFLLDLAEGKISVENFEKIKQS